MTTVKVDENYGELPGNYGSNYGPTTLIQTNRGPKIFISRNTPSANVKRDNVTYYMYIKDGSGLTLTEEEVLEMFIGFMRSIDDTERIRNE